MIGHLAPYTVSPTDLIARRSTWEGEGYKTKTHVCVTRAGYIDHIRKNDRYANWTIFRVTVFLRM